MAVALGMSASGPTPTEQLNPTMPWADRSRRVRRPASGPKAVLSHPLPLAFWSCATPGGPPGDPFWLLGMYSQSWLAQQRYHPARLGVGYKFMEITIGESL